MILDWSAALAGACLGVPLSRLLHQAFVASEKVWGGFDRRHHLVHTALLPLAVVGVGVFAGSVLGWRSTASDAWIGGVWGAVGSVTSPYVWPSIRAAARRAITGESG